VRFTRALPVSDRIPHLPKDEFIVKFAGQVYFDVIPMILFRRHCYGLMWIESDEFYVNGWKFGHDMDEELTNRWWKDK